MFLHSQGNLIRNHLNLKKEHYSCAGALKQKTQLKVFKNWQHLLIELQKILPLLLKFFQGIRLSTRHKG
jgi:hypothetical protein